jgi:large subunit ribosomal protein L23
MADEKKVEAAATKEAAPKAAKAKKAPAKKEAVEAPKAEAKKVSFAAPTAHDYEVVKDPRITEKSMAQLQNANKVTVKVADGANKIEIKESFQRLYGAKVLSVNIVNQRAKEKTRGGKYKGSVSGFKKAIVTLADGNAVDLFKE